MRHRFKIIPESIEAATALKDMLEDPRFNGMFMLRVMLTVPDVDNYLEGGDSIKEFVLDDH